MRVLSLLAAVAISGCFLSHTIDDDGGARDAGVDATAMPDCGPLPPPDPTGRCMLMLSAEHVGATCELDVCSGEPVELCVTRGSPTEVVLPHILDGITCGEPAATPFSHCDRTVDSCQWRPHHGSDSFFTPADWANLCTASEQPDVSRVDCVVPLLI